MPSHQNIDRSTPVFHGRAAMRLWERHPHVDQARRAIDPWEAAGRPPHGRRYRDEWRKRLHSGSRTFEDAVRAASGHAVSLPDMSPFGFLPSDEERLDIRRETIAA